LQLALESSSPNSIPPFSFTTEGKTGPSSSPQKVSSDPPRRGKLQTSVSLNFYLVYARASVSFLSQRPFFPWPSPAVASPFSCHAEQVRESPPQIWYIDNSRGPCSFFFFLSNSPPPPQGEKVNIFPLLVAFPLTVLFLFFFFLKKFSPSGRRKRSPFFFLNPRTFPLSPWIFRQGLPPESPPKNPGCPPLFMLPFFLGPRGRTSLFFPRPKFPYA